MNEPMVFGKKWLWAGLVVAFLNPIFSGLVVGSLYLTESGLKKYGRVVLAAAVIWGVVVFWGLRKFYPGGLPMIPNS